MAGKLISDLNSVVNLGLADAMEIDKDVSGARTSYKTTVKEIVDFANQNIADEYDSTSNYAVGDYVMYESALYKCTASTTGTFDPTKWTQVIVTDEMGSGGGGNANERVISYADYMALSEAEKMNNTTYYIYDINGDGSQFQPVIYSETEREVGVWKDGKPLYEKTFTYSGAITKNQWYSINSDTSFRIVDFEGFFENSSNGSRYVIPFFRATNLYTSAVIVDGYELQILVDGIDNLTGYTVTLRYTKSTDAAGSGTWTPQGVPAVHYSTDEQVIGTWIDGSTLYEKTYTGLNVEIINANTWYDTGLSATGIDTFVDGKLIDVNNQSYPVNVAFMSSNTKIGISCGMANRTGVKLTIQYTKSS